MHAYFAALAALSQSIYVLKPDLAWDAYAVWPDHSYGVALLAPLANGPFYGVFGVEVASRARFTRVRLDWLGLGVKTRVEWLSTESTAVQLGGRYELSYVMTRKDSAYNDGNGHRLLGSLMVFTRGLFVDVAAGTAYGQGPLAPRVLLVGLGSYAP